MARLLKDTTIGDIPILDYIYPVGVIIETTDKNFNPSTYWGGTWKSIVGVNKAVNEFFKSAVSGGATSNDLCTYQTICNKTDNTGEGASRNNLQYTAYIWERTA